MNTLVATSAIDIFITTGQPDEDETHHLVVVSFKQYYQDEHKQWPYYPVLH